MSIENQFHRSGVANAGGGTKSKLALQFWRCYNCIVNQGVCFAYDSGASSRPMHSPATGPAQTNN
jgi:hypothetical protein